MYVLRKWNVICFLVIGYFAPNGVIFCMHYFALMGITGIWQNNWISDSTELSFSLITGYSMHVSNYWLALPHLHLIQQGDSIIRYYELVPESPHCHWLTNYSATVPQRGVCYMPKRGCDVTTNEVAKCFKLTAKGVCEPISFTVPRKVCCCLFIREVAFSCAKHFLRSSQSLFWGKILWG